MLKQICWCGAAEARKMPGTSSSIGIMPPQLASFFNSATTSQRKMPKRFARRAFFSSSASQFQTWLFRIAANKARDFRERGQAAKRGHGQKPLSLNAEDPETGLTLDPPSGESPPDLRLLQAENAHLVHESLDRLGEPCREIIELRYFADLSYEEISASLDLNMKTVSSRLSKCLDKLELTMRTLFSGGQPSILPSNS
jgi:RNA polymerase sigma-70 factor (ECF subfamily)